MTREIEQIDFKMKIDLQASLLALKEGESRTVPNKYVKPSGVRSSIKWLNQKGYSFTCTENGCFDYIIVTRLK